MKTGLQFMKKGQTSNIRGKIKVYLIVFIWKQVIYKNKELLLNLGWTHSELIFKGDTEIWKVIVTDLQINIGGF